MPDYLHSAAWSQSTDVHLRGCCCILICLSPPALTTCTNELLRREREGGEMRGDGINVELGRRRVCGAPPCLRTVWTVLPGRCHCSRITFLFGNPPARSRINRGRENGNIAALHLNTFGSSIVTVWNRVKNTSSAGNIFRPGLVCKMIFTFDLYMHAAIFEGEKNTI